MSIREIPINIYWMRVQYEICYQKALRVACIASKKFDINKNVMQYILFVWKLKDSNVEILENMKILK